MSGIRGKHTRIELLVRQALFRMGFRYRLHDKKLPVKPDLVLPKYRAVIFVNGCFWHGHNCHLYREPKTNTLFWRQKIEKNKENNYRSLQLLHAAGWRTLTIWECKLRALKDQEETLAKIASWIRMSSETDGEI